MLEIKEALKSNMPKVMVLGIGGGGNNAVTRMMSSPSENVTYAALRSANIFGDITVTMKTS